MSTKNKYSYLEMIENTKEQFATFLSQITLIIMSIALGTYHLSVIRVKYLLLGKDKMSWLDPKKTESVYEMNKNN